VTIATHPAIDPADPLRHGRSVARVKRGVERDRTVSPPRGAAAPADWLEAWRRGDREAFGRLHAHYARMVHAVVLARVPAGDAEDVVQDVFVKALRSLAGLRDAEAVGPWLCRVARNSATDFLRRRRSTEALPPEIARPAPPVAEAREALDAVRALPEAYRETLLMRLVEGMSGPEIAERTGLTPGSVRVNLHRGMQLLRTQLSAGGAE